MDKQGKTSFHAVMLDETRCEFGVTVEAQTKGEAYEILREYYPESCCVQLESPEDTREREERIYRQIQEEMDGIVPPGYYDNKE